MSDQELKYKITTEGNPAGANAVASSIDKIDKSAKSAGSATGSAAANVDKLGKASTGAAVGGDTLGKVLTGVAHGADGTSGSVVGMINAFRALYGMFITGTGPFGMALVAIAAIGGAIFALKDKFTAPKKSAEELAQEIEKVNKIMLDAVVTQLKGIETAANDGKAAIIAEAAEIDRMADAKLARDKAKVEADKNLSDEAKREKITALQRAREDERINQTAATMDAKAQMDEGAASDIRIKAEALDAQLKIAQSAKSNAELLKTRADGLLKELRGGFDKQGKLLPEFEDKARQYREADAAQRAAAAKVPAAEAALAGENGLEATAKAAKEAARKAAEAADKSRAEAEAFKREQAGLKPLTNETRSLEDKKNRGQTAEEKAAFEKEKARIAALPKEVLDTQVAIGMYTNEAAYSAVRGEKNWQKYNKGQTQQPAAPSINQPGAGATRDPLAQGPFDSRIQLGGGPLSQSAIDPRNQITRGQLKPGSDTIAGAADKVATAADSASSSNAATQESLAKIAEGTGKIAESGQALADGISTASTDLATANESLATAITGATSDLNTMMVQAVTLGGQNVQAYTELSGQVRELAQQVRTFQSQLAAARSRK